MKPEVLLKLDAEFNAAPVLRATAGASEEELRGVSEALGLRLPGDYVEFVRRYGGGIVGPYPIYGTKPVGPMGKRWSVIDVNRWYRAERWPSIEDWLIMSMDHAGNPIGIADDGTVRVFDHDFLREIVLAPDFEDFLTRVCLTLT